VPVKTDLPAVLLEQPEICILEVSQNGLTFKDLNNHFACVRAAELQCRAQLEEIKILDSEE